MPCDHSSRDWSKLSTTKESQRLLRTNRNLEEARKHPPREQREREERKEEDGGEDSWAHMHDPVKTFNFSETLVGWRTVKEQISVALKSVCGNLVQYLYETNTNRNDHKLFIS